MQHQEESLRWKVALGWVISLVLLTIQFASRLAHGMLTEADHYFRSLHVDLGVAGLRTLLVIACAYALMPIFVLVMGGARLRAPRWIAVAAAALALVSTPGSRTSNIPHHLLHLVAGAEPVFVVNVPDLTMQLILLWVLVNSVRWARYGATARAAREVRGVPAAPELNPV